ncbi:hypothetical protein HDE_12820 [Halotydeus destructor]|nr:hypothetical protein HDE_12820 [Halotydeus destructor]
MFAFLILQMNQQAIEEGMKILCTRRCNKLTSVKLMKPERWIQDTEFIQSLQLLPDTLMTLIEDDERLESLRYQLFSNEDTIAKQRKLVLSTLEMSILSEELDKSDNSIIAGLRCDFNTVKRLDIIFSTQEFEVPRLARCITLLPNLEAIGIQFEEDDYPEFNQFVINLISLLKQIDEKILLKIRHWLVLEFPALIARLKDYLPRLQIYNAVGSEKPLMYPGASLAKYQELETI